MPNAIDLNASSYTYVPKVRTVLDAAGGLVKADLKDAESGDDPAYGLVYGKGLQAGGTVPTAAIYLKDKDLNIFSVDADKVSMVATGTELSLFVYAADGTTDKYSFAIKGTEAVLKSNTPETLTAEAFSAAEMAAKRDLDGDSTVGAKLVKTGDDNGMLDATGGLFRVTSREQDLFVVGAPLGKAAQLDVSKATLLNSDGTAWKAGDEFTTLRAVSTTALNTTTKKQETTWTVYGTTDDGTTTAFKFGADLKLSTDEPQVLTAKDIASLEKKALRDLNNDSKFGVDIVGNALDAKTGLFKGSVLGQDFYLVGAGLKSGTAKSPTDLSGALLNPDGTAWALPTGYTVATMVKGATNTDPAYSVYVYKNPEGGEADRNTVLRFDFKAETKDGKATGDFLVDEAAVDGVEMTADDLAAAEKKATRDLNGDGVFGVRIDKAADKIGGLFAAKALGNDFLLVGKALTSSAAKPLDLSTALRNADGTAWKPEGVETVGTGGTNSANLRIVVNADSKNYEVYVKEDGGVHAKYTFDKDSYKQIGDKAELSLEDLATAEATYKRDLNGDSAFGVVVDSQRDAKAGLYIGSFENQSNIYLRAGNVKLDVGSRVAAKAKDLSMALSTDEGYWNVDEGYTVRSAFTDEDGKFVLVATGTDNPLDIRKYSFGDDNKLITDEAKTGDMDVYALAAQEAKEKRDLNKDDIVGVKFGTTLDKTGGLHTVSVGKGDNTKTFLAVGASASAIKDLSTALLDSEGNAWAVPEGETAAALVTRKTDGEVSGYDIYTKNADNQYVRHSFTAERKYNDSLEDNGKVLSAIELSDDEVGASRDINADKSVGAKVTTVVDKTGGLYQASMSGSTMTLVSGTNPGRGTALGNKVLFDTDGTSAWQADDGYKLTAVVGNSDDGYSVYAVKNSDANDVRRYTFGADRVFSEMEQLTADDLVKAEKTAGRDFNVDKAVGLNVADAVDKKGALYSANVLGKTFLVVGEVGKVLKTGKNADSAVDLSKALLDSEGGAWKQEDGWSIGGLVINKNNDGDVTGYDVYSYRKDGNEIAEVKKSSWTAKMEFVDTNPADLVSLVEVEAKQKRDLSGDNVVGFRRLGTLTAGYAGVTEARVAGNTTFMLAGANVKQGTPTNPLTSMSALLTEDGSGPWSLAGTDFKVKSVDEVQVTTDDGTVTKRHVYASNADGSEIRRYVFDKATGKLEGDPETVSAVEMAALEVTRKRDMSGDGKTGVAQASALMDGSRATGLLNVKMLGKDYLVVGNAPAAGRSINLAAALLKADGSAWAAPTEGFTLKGVYQPAEGPLEVYGTKDDKTIVRYKFDKNDADGTYTLKTADEDDDGSSVVTGVDMAKSEATARKDLNGDGAIGFKVVAEDDDNKRIRQSNGVTLGKASIDTLEVAEEGDTQTVDNPTVFIIGKTLDKMGLLADNLANTAALFASADTYWKPAEGESIKSLVQTPEAPTKLSIYAQKSTEGVTSYVRYNFEQGDDKLWLLASTDGTKDLTSTELVAEEASTKRDLNVDTAVGLKVGTEQALTGLTQAVIDEKTFFIVGSASSGTGTRPLDLTNAKLLKAKDSDDAWTPGAGISLEGFETLATVPAEGEEGAGAKYKATYTVEGEAKTQYFDASFKAL